MTYRVLAIDGGGVRGLLTAVLLERLEDACPGYLDQVDLFAGTSTGGILALGLAAGLAPAEARALYEEQAGTVFADSLWDNIKDIGFTRGAQYSNTNLKRLLRDQFGDDTLDDLPRKVLIASFELDNKKKSRHEVRSWKPKFFHNYPGPDSDGQERVVDVALRTAAAPAYFPTYQGYVDGGVIANNPAMCALAQALDGDTGGQRLGEVRLLSLGTGRNPKFLDVGDADWGWSQWAIRLPFANGSVNLPLLELILDGGVDLVDYQCRRLLDGHYHRLNPSLPVPINLDDVAQLPKLITLGEETDLTATVTWLQTHWKLPG